MCKIALLLASLVCVGHGRAQSSSGRFHFKPAAESKKSLRLLNSVRTSHSFTGSTKSRDHESVNIVLNPLKVVSMFFLALKPPAFNPSGVVMPWTRSTTSSGLNPRALSSSIKSLNSKLELGARARTFMEEAASPVDTGSVAFVLLAGGSGKRMGASMPKQYLPLKGREIALWSLDIISAMEEVGEVVVVCDPTYQDVFTGAAEKGFTHGKPLLFAPPGKERMDSVENGVKAVENGKLVCIHDSARPLVRVEDVRQCFADAAKYGAAVLGVPCKATVKQAQPVGEDGVVKVSKTLDRSTLWEMHTPQVIEPNMLKRGYEHVRKEGAEVTDDVSIIEAIGEPVVITEDSYENLKITTPDDLVAAEGILDAREQ
mmetsp:Transcript_52762/g.99077  ORF Transcript_52762/g.99077 Transcript_52762/m.99077 type:complete len:372 (+) Transcript_52762:107-1222(+)